MARKKKPDKLSLDAAEARAAGMSYGKWKALQGEPVIVEKKIPAGWSVCKYCGKPFKPRVGSAQKYCEEFCQRSAYTERRKKLDVSNQA